MEPPAPALAGRVFPAEQSGKPQGKQVSLVSFLKLERCHACEQPLKLFRCSVPQLCPTVCDPTHCSTPGLPVYHQLRNFMSIASVMPSNHLILCCPLLLLPSIFPNIRVFSNESAASGGQSIGVSASASVLPMNIQDWFPLGCTGLISLQSKGLSRVFPNTTI